MPLPSDAAVPTAVAAAMSAWLDVLGAEHVLTSPSVLVRASTATYEAGAAVSAVIRPANRDQVQRCLAIANRFHVPIYPISTGKNWGYGSGAPVRDSVLLDLGRMNRIVELNEELAYVTVEPGVTQRQLHAELRARGSRLWMDATGASPDCSIVGNTLERGFGHTPMGEHCNYACAFEVVLPNGECIETGFGRFNARAAPVYRWGLGPSVDGLFAQSNLGVVTRMTVWLMPKPERYCAFFFQTERPVGEIVDALRPLRLDGTLRSVVHIGNDYKVLSSSGQYPWTETGGQTPLSRDAMARLRSKHGIGRWNGSGGVYGTRAEMRGAKAALRCALRRKASRVAFIDEGTVSWLQLVEKPYSALTGKSDLSRALRMVPPLLGLLRGEPTNDFLASAYWRKRMTVPADPDPDADRCGLLWASPVAPATKSDTQKMADTAEHLALTHGFEPLISLSMINERSTISTISLTYDRDVPGEDERAAACYRDITGQLLDRGYPPYRLNTMAMDYGRVDGAYKALIQSIRRAVDPNGILAPGRYE
jgi:4-cresol dehydrogenase (hydroxylating)